MGNHGRTRNIASLAVALGFIISVTTFAPAYGIEQKTAGNINEYENAQSLTVSSKVQNVALKTEQFEFEIIPPPAVAANASAVRAGSASPSIFSGSLLDAARSQIGWGQDCTALVENALRALGYSVGDLGPMGFGGYGVQVSPDQAQPGDIMMRGGHVAIYAGGTAIHGGYSGTTVESSHDSNPYNYAVIIRVQ